MFITSKTNQIRWFKPLRRLIQIGSCLAVVLCFGCNSQIESDDPQEPENTKLADSKDVDDPVASPKVVETPQLTSNDKAIEPTLSNEDVEPAAPSTPPKKVYTEADLNKNNTVLLLAMPPDIRARTILWFLREDLTTDEMDSAVRFVMEHDHFFQTMIQRRAAILDEAVYGDDTMIKMHRLKIDIFETSDRLRSLANNKFLTKEQQAAKKLRREEAAKLNDQRRKKNDKK